MAKVTIMLRVKTDDGKYPFLPAIMSSNGRLEPLAALYNGRKKTFAEGTYYLRYTENGKQRYEAVGTDPAIATAKRIERSGYLDARAAGLHVVEAPLPQTHGGGLAETIETYLAEIRANKKKRTWQAYANSLAFFARSCKKVQVQSIGRTDMLEFKTFLKSQQMGKRSVYNNFLNVMVFLKWAKVQTGILKNDWPPKPEREPEEYSDAEIEKLLTAALDEERLILNCFLCSGVRSGELAHLTYGDIDFTHSVWTIRDKEDWDTKTEGSKRNVPVPEWLTKKIADRMSNGRRKTDLIFFNSNGGPNLHLLRIVKRVAKRAGLTDIRVDDHKWRSTAISRWLRAGNSVQDVMSWCGHKSLSTVLRYAAKLNLQKPETRAKATSAFAKFDGVGD